MSFPFFEAFSTAGHRGLINFLLASEVTMAQKSSTSLQQLLVDLGNYLVNSCTLVEGAVILSSINQ